MKKINCMLASLILLCGTAYGANKIYPLGITTYGIIADANVWTCTPSTADSADWMGGVPCIKGKANSLPIEFSFFFQGKLPSQAANALISLKQLLLHCAQKTNTVFYNLSINEIDKEIFIANGTYCDNIASGFCAFKIINLPGYSIIMFVKVKDSLLDLEASQKLIDKAFALITPLVG